MPVWKYAGNKPVTREEIEQVLVSIPCFKCGKDLHSDDCPFARLRAELIALKEFAE